MQDKSEVSLIGSRIMQRYKNLFEWLPPKLRGEEFVEWIKRKHIEHLKEQDNEGEAEQPDNN